jgi:hypothetical protein
MKQVIVFFIVSLLAVRCHKDQGSEICIPDIYSRPPGYRLGEGMNNTIFKNDYSSLKIGNRATGLCQSDYFPLRFIF